LRRRRRSFRRIIGENNTEAMHLEAWYAGEKLLDFNDTEWDSDKCVRSEATLPSDGTRIDSNIGISLKGIFMLYGKHRSNTIDSLTSRQDCNLAILSFIFGGNLHVLEKNYMPYRVFTQEVHSTFFTTRRELVFEVPKEIESFRIYLSPERFLDLLARYHGRFSVYADKVKHSIAFNLPETAMPITPRMKHVIREILQHQVTDQGLSAVFYETKITELFGCQLEQMSNAKTTPNVPTLEKSKLIEVKRILEENYLNPPTLEQLSRLVGTNENKLKRGFKQQFGHTVYNYVLHYRMQNAAEWLDNKALSLEEIASKAGYTDGAHFSRAFKKVFGVPPGKYRGNV
jgi:AraC-like DNA-binding protein